MLTRKPDQDAYRRQLDTARTYGALPGLLVWLLLLGNTVMHHIDPLTEAPLVIATFFILPILSMLTMYATIRFNSPDRPLSEKERRRASE